MQYSNSTDYYSPYSPVHDHYSFSRGSSFVYPHEDYMAGRGDPSTSPAAPVYVPGATSSFDMAGLAFGADNNSVAAVSGREYSHEQNIQGWQWECHPTTTSSHLHPHALVHPPLLPQLPTAESPLLDLPSTIKTALTMGQTHNLRSPTAQLPTPAAMAVLLNPNTHTRRIQTPQLAVDVAAQQPPLIIQMPSGVPDTTALMSVPDILSREKKHACTMCHKRFDRPSTLRKHLLVHTGEKAFVCDTCGRRFGVASNLNRHVRRCILKPVNAVPGGGGGGTSSSTSPPASASVAPSDMPSDHDSSGNKVSAPKHGRTPSSTGSTSSSSSSSCNPPPTQKGGVDGTSRKPTGQKRRRRAPSPSLWVPWSLRTFNLTCEEFYRSSPVPLPPVRKSLPKEERDSWDENVASRPYHPVEWRGVLPGPGLGHGLGLGGKDVRNINFGASGGIMLGRVLVF